MEQDICNVIVACVLLIDEKELKKHIVALYNVYSNNVISDVTSDV